MGAQFSASRSAQGQRMHVLTMGMLSPESQRIIEQPTETMLPEMGRNWSGSCAERCFLEDLVAGLTESRSSHGIMPVVQTSGLPCWLQVSRGAYN